MISYTTKTILHFYNYNWREKDGIEYYSITVKGAAVFNSIRELEESWRPWLKFLGKRATITWHLEEEIAYEPFASEGQVIVKPQPFPEMYMGDTEGMIVITTEKVVVIITAQRWRG